MTETVVDCVTELKDVALAFFDNVNDWLALSTIESLKVTEGLVLPLLVSDCDADGVEVNNVVADIVKDTVLDALVLSDADSECVELLDKEMDAEVLNEMLNVNDADPVVLVLALPEPVAETVRVELELFLSDALVDLLRVSVAELLSVSVSVLLSDTSRELVTLIECRRLLLTVVVDVTETLSVSERVCLAVTVLVLDGLDDVLGEGEEVEVPLVVGVWL